MNWFRIIVPNYKGRRIVGDWQRDIDLVIQNIAAVWIHRAVTFTIEISTTDPRK